MFLAGADGQTPELRPPSIKGAMRFWWRAVNGHLNLNQLKQKETEIFGGGGTDARRSSFDVVVEYDEINSSSAKLNGKTFKVKGHEVDILDYLAYGTNSYKKDLKQTTFDRKYIKTGWKFKIKINYRNIENVSENIITPFILMSRIGGLGSKTRNGFGKFHIEKIENEKKEELIIPHISEVLKRKKGKPKSFLKLSDNIKTFQLIKSADKPLDILSSLGLIYKSARESLEEKHQYYKRSYIASPLQVDKENKGLMERHAKSYFLTVSKSGNKYKGYIYFIPYKFLEGFDDYMELEEYKKVMNNNHEDFLTNEVEQVTEEWFQSKFEEFHQEYNIFLNNNHNLNEL
jgi:CRISPR-associated protein Cmr1